MIQKIKLQLPYKILKNKIAKLLLEVVRRYKSVILTVIFLSIVADILFIAGFSDVRIYTIIAVYTVGVLVYKIRSDLTFKLSLILLTIMFMEFAIGGTSDKTEKAAVWLFFFLLVGILQQFKE